MTYEQNYLAHYGIKGQKWGVRRFQNEDRTWTAAGKERYGSKGEARKSAPKTIKGQPQGKVSFLNRSAIDAANAVEKLSEQDLTKIVNRDESKKGDNSDAKRQAALNIVATLANPLNAVFLAKQGMDAASAKHKMNAFIKRREKNSEFDEESGLYLKHAGQYNEQQDLNAVNPGFKNFNSNTKNNCMLCTTTYDMRKRGYDVTAQLDSEGYNFGDLKRWYPKATFEKSTRVNADGTVMKRKEYVANTLSKIEKQGNGARGNLMIWFATGWDGSGGGGHSIAYEVQNGSVVVKDGQTGKIYRNPEKLLNMTDACLFSRLDNIEPDLDRIKSECVR